MVKKITFFNRDDAIEYRMKMRQLGYVTKILQPEGKYEVIVAGGTPEWKTGPVEGETFSGASEDVHEPFLTRQ
jgi:hypothetical protein